MAVLLGTILSNLAVAWWFDALIVHKYAFQKSPKNFYIPIILSTNLPNAGVSLTQALSPTLSTKFSTAAPAHSKNKKYKRNTDLLHTLLNYLSGKVR